MSTDRETLTVYDKRAADYAARFTGDRNLDLETFIAALPTGAQVLDLGCGPGHAAAQMAHAGHSVEATDASAEMVKLAQAHPGVTARQASFDDIAGTDLYDGIWTNFALLHAPRSAMPGHLAALRRALRPGGLFHIGMKTGTGEKRDEIGRLYTYYTEDELAGLLRAAGFTPFSSRTGAEPGLDGVVAPWVTIAAHG